MRWRLLIWTSEIAGSRNSWKKSSDEHSLASDWSWWLKISTFSRFKWKKMCFVKKPFQFITYHECVSPELSTARTPPVVILSPHMAGVAAPAIAADSHSGFPVSRQTSWAGTNVDRPSLWLTSKLCLASSGRTRGEMEQLVLMKQLQDTNYYVNVLLLSSATANSLLHLEVQSLPCVCVCMFLFS